MKGTSTKIQNVAGSANKYSVVFGATEFGVATGFSTLNGPFSLQINIDNDTGTYNPITEPTPLYIGIQIDTQELSYDVADRVHIAYCPKKEAITVSGNSIAQLANIRGIVTKITVYLYTFTATQSPQNVTIQLILDAPFAAPTPLPFIGRDTQAYEPGFQVYSSSAAGIAGSVSNVVLADSGLVPRELRYRLRSVSMFLGTSAALATASILLAIFDRTGTQHDIWYCVSDTAKNTNQIQDFNLILNANYRAKLLGTNGVATPIGAFASILCEVLY